LVKVKYLGSDEKSIPIADDLIIVSKKIRRCS